MRRSLGVLLILLGIAGILFAVYPWAYVQYLRLSNPGPYHYYYIVDSAKVTSAAIVVVGVALIGTGFWMYSSQRD